MSIEIVGEERLTLTCLGIAERTHDLAPAFADEIERLEHAEESLFTGGYVLTGRLRDSLTRSSSEGAIRRVTMSSLEFGTSIWYAPFQVENPGPQTPAGGLERKDHPSAVLKLEPETAIELTEAAGDYIMRGSAGLIL